MTLVRAEFVATPAFWTINPWELGLLVAGAVITLGILGVLIVVLTRKERKQDRPPRE